MFKLLTKTLTVYLTLMLPTMTYGHTVFHPLILMMQKTDRDFFEPSEEVTFEDGLNNYMIKVMQSNQLPDGGYSIGYQYEISYNFPFLDTEEGKPLAYHSGFAVVVVVCGETDPDGDISATPIIEEKGCKDMRVLDPFTYYTSH